MQGIELAQVRLSHSLSPLYKDLDNKNYLPKAPSRNFWSYCQRGNIHLIQRTRYPGEKLNKEFENERRIRLLRSCSLRRNWHGWADQNDQGGCWYYSINSWETVGLALEGCDKPFSAASNLPWLSRLNVEARVSRGHRESFRIREETCSLKNPKSAVFGNHPLVGAWPLPEVSLLWS